MFTQVKAAWNKFWFEPVSPAPICLFRIFVGLLALADSLVWYPDFLTWYGNYGVVPFSLMRHLNPGLSVLLIHNFSDQQTYALLALHMVVCAFVVMGFCTRTSFFLMWLFLCSISHRQVLLWHHIGLFLRLYSFLMIFAPAGAMYSIDAWIKKQRGRNSEPKLYAPMAQRLLQFQIACVYFRASVGKLLGNSWREGTAVYYAMHYTGIVRHAAPAFLDHSWFYQLMTYYTIVIEFCMFTLVWVPPVSKFVLLGALFLHCGIEWCMNLDLLEWAVVCSYVLFLPPAGIEKFMLRLGGFFSAVPARFSHLR